MVPAGTPRRCSRGSTSHPRAACCCTALPAPERPSSRVRSQRAATARGRRCPSTCGKERTSCPSGAAGGTHTCTHTHTHAHTHTHTHPHTNTRGAAGEALTDTKRMDGARRRVGESERQLRLLFEEAQKQQPAIIFFDEIDGLAPVRSSKSDQVRTCAVRRSASRAPLKVRPGEYLCRTTAGIVPSYAP